MPLSKRQLFTVTTGTTQPYQANDDVLALNKFQETFHIHLFQRNAEYYLLMNAVKQRDT